MAVNDAALALMTKINKKYGAGSVVLGSQMRTPTYFPTGSLYLDYILGGGFPANQWTEVIGEFSTAKTSIVHKAIAANQARDENFTALWVAAESYDHAWASQLGVDVSRVIVHSTNAMEEAYEVMLQATESRGFDAIILDSYPALIPIDEDNKAMDELSVALGARLTGKFFRKAGKATARSLIEDERPVFGVIINQYRINIGAFSPHGTPKTTPGGMAKNFAFWLRLELARAEWIDEKRPGKGTARVGQVIKAKTIKNKSTAPQQTATVRFFFDDAPELGFRKGDYDVVPELFVLGIQCEAVEVAGSYYTIGEERFRGKEAAMAALYEDLDLRAALDERIREVAFRRHDHEVLAA